MKVWTNLPLGDWRSVAAAARAAEEAGFDGAMTLELGNDPFPPLAIAALATERIALTTSIAVAFPRSPTVMAHTAWDLQAESRGRFHLGIGSQVKGHNERRYGVPWSPPAPRLGEYIEAMRAIWRTWAGEGPLAFDGTHYKLSLMTPDFSPKPSGQPMPPVSIAAVGDAMLRLAGRVCDGVRLHPVCSRRYLEEVCLPRIREGFAKSGRKREHFELHGGGFVLTGPDEETVAKRMDWARFRIGFYGSTRTYLPILSMHGLQELGLELHKLSVEGRWSEMASRVSDDTVRLFAAAGTYGEIAKAIEQRYGGLADVCEMDFPADAPIGLKREIVQDINRIPTPFRSFATG